MGMLKDICQDIFSVKNKYVGDFKFKIVRILGLKLSKSLGYQTKGKNNKIYIIENSVRKELKKCIYGLRINIKGDNNEVIINAPYKFDNCSIAIEGNNSSIFISSDVDLHNTCFVSYNCSKIFIGEAVTINGANIYCASDNSCIKLGDDCMLSWGIHIISGDFHNITAPEDGEIINRGKFCEIGKHVWIGHDASICKNVRIADNSIIGAHAVVTKSFAENNAVIAGNPAKIVKQGVEWHRERV